MIISTVYENDCNTQLKYVQHDEYWRSIGSIFEAARTELLRADAIIGSNLLIAEKAREIGKFDHRVLQDAHDIIAAAFRYNYDDGGQLKLGETQKDQRLRYLREWVLWLSEQLAELARHSQFVRSTVESVVLSNTEVGYIAENRLCDLLLTHFSAGDWMLQGGYLKTYVSSRA